MADNRERVRASNLKWLHMKAQSVQYSLCQAKFDGASAPGKYQGRILIQRYIYTLPYVHGRTNVLIEYPGLSDHILITALLLGSEDRDCSIFPLSKFC